MRQIPQISNAEWEVMKILWGNAPQTASQVIGSLKDQTQWSPNTVRTLLARLIKKEVVDFQRDENDSRIYYYYPLISEQECVKAEGQSFLKRIYGGAFKTMIANLLEEEDLSVEDIEDLKRILDEKKS